MVALALTEIVSLSPSRAPRGGRVCFGNLFQLPRLNVVNETPHRNLLRDPGMRFHLLDLLAHVLFKIAESVEGHRRHGSRSRLLLKLRAQIFIFEGQHPAVRMVDDDEFLRAEKLVGNNERPQRVFGHNSSGIPNDVGVSRFQAQDLRDDEPSIHACHDRQLTTWWKRKVSVSKVLRIGFVGFEDFVCDAHVRPPLDSAWLCLWRGYFLTEMARWQTEKGQVLG